MPLLSGELDSHRLLTTSRHCFSHCARMQTIVSPLGGSTLRAVLGGSMDSRDWNARFATVMFRGYVVTVGGLRWAFHWFRL